MIDDNEPVTEEASAFAEQWAKLWATASAAMQTVGWDNDKHGTFYGELWEAPQGMSRTRWAADLAMLEATDAKSFAEANGNAFVMDAALTMMSLAFVLEGVAEAEADRATVRAASLWSLNAATYMFRRHAQLPAIKDALAAQQAATDAANHMREAERRLAPKLLVSERQAEAAEKTAQMRRDRWHPQGKAIARQVLGANPYATDTAIVEAIMDHDGDGFEARSSRQIRLALARWRADPIDPLPPRLTRP